MENLIIKVLETYEVSDSVDTSEIMSLKSFKTNLYGQGNIYSFDYKNNHYYVVDDYSLMDNPDYIKKVIEEINPKLTGGPLKNPASQSDGAVYACGIEGAEYYLWRIKK